MFSTDKNIEKLAQLILSIKDYVGLQKELLQLNAITKIAQLLSALLLAVVFAFFILLIIIFLSFAAAFALSAYMPSALAFLAVAGIYVLLLLLVSSNREQWIKRPLLKLFAEILTTD